MSTVSEKFTMLLLSSRKAAKNMLGLKEKLLFLLNSRPLSPMHIMELLVINKSNLAHLTHGMIKSGLIEKCIDSQDRRRAQYNITDEGKSLIETRLETIEKSFANFLTNQKDIDAAKEKFDSVLDILSFL